MFIPLVTIENWVRYLHMSVKVNEACITIKVDLKHGLERPVYYAIQV